MILGELVEKLQALVAAGHGYTPVQAVSRLTEMVVVDVAADDEDEYVNLYVEPQGVGK